MHVNTKYQWLHLRQTSSSFLSSSCFIAFCVLLLQDLSSQFIPRPPPTSVKTGSEVNEQCIIICLLLIFGHPYWPLAIKIKSLFLLHPLTFCTHTHSLSLIHTHALHSLAHTHTLTHSVTVTHTLTLHTSPTKFVGHICWSPIYLTHITHPFSWRAQVHEMQVSSQNDTDNSVARITTYTSIYTRLFPPWLFCFYFVTVFYFKKITTLI